MVPIQSLWLPILLSSVIVFVASSIIHMMLRYHGPDYRAVPGETDVMEAMRKFNIPPGDYMIPRPATMDAMKSPEYKEKVTRGPVALMTVMPNGMMNVGQSMMQWFVYLLVVGIFTAYVTGHALAPGAGYRAVFRFAGCTAFMGYALALWQDSIWHKKAIGTTLRFNLDGLIYGLLTAGTFGWLWPK